MKARFDRVKGWFDRLKTFVIKPIVIIIILIGEDDQ